MEKEKRGRIAGLPNRTIILAAGKRETKIEVVERGKLENRGTSLCAGQNKVAQKRAAQERKTNKRCARNRGKGIQVAREAVKKRGRRAR